MNMKWLNRKVIAGLLVVIAGVVGVDLSNEQADTAAVVIEQVID